MDPYRQRTNDSRQSVDKHFGQFIGQSSSMQDVYRTIERAAKSKASVFITGESGTGKELVAQAIHQYSARYTYDLVAINCAAIPHTLIESEIFGHVKGAFTGADSNRIGAAKRADKGTLFLDELGEMPIDLQAKLLRVIQSGSFTPLGTTKAEHVDIRFICATNRDPVARIKEGFLREDLYYRLNVIPVHLPPLRMRKVDIKLLAEHFLYQAAQEEQKPFKMLSKEALSALEAYTWPGNVRELENVIRNVVVMCDGDCVEHHMLRLQNTKNSIEILNNDKSHTFAFKTPDHIQALKVIEEDIIKQAIRVCEGNITEAARRLCINPSTIHRKQKQWDTQPY